MIRRKVRRIRARRVGRSRGRGVRRRGRMVGRGGGRERILMMRRRRRLIRSTAARTPTIQS